MINKPGPGAINRGGEETAVGPGYATRFTIDDDPQPPSPTIPRQSRNGDSPVRRTRDRNKCIYEAATVSDIIRLRWSNTIQVVASQAWITSLPREGNRGGGGGGQRELARIVWVGGRGEGEGGREYRGQKEWDRKGARCLSLSLSLVSFVPVWFEAHRSKGSGSHDPAWSLRSCDLSFLTRPTEGYERRPDYVLFVYVLFDPVPGPHRGLFSFLFVPFVFHSTSSKK